MPAPVVSIPEPTAPATIVSANTVAAHDAEVAAETAALSSPDARPQAATINATDYESSVPPLDVASPAEKAATARLYTQDELENILAQARMAGKLNDVDDVSPASVKASPVETIEIDVIEDGRWVKKTVPVQNATAYKSVDDYAVLTDAEPFDVGHAWLASGKKVGMSWRWVLIGQHGANDVQAGWQPVDPKTISIPGMPVSKPVGVEKECYCPGGFYLCEMPTAIKEARDLAAFNQRNKEANQRLLAIPADVENALSDYSPKLVKPLRVDSKGRPLSGATDADGRTIGISNDSAKARMTAEAETLMRSMGARRPAY